MALINFEAKLFKPDASEKVGSGVLLSLPKSVSAKLPSRGMTMVKGTINDAPFKVHVEPDGKGSHWFKVNETLRKAAKADIGDMVTLEIEPTKEWPEPKIPTDLKNALDDNPKANATWKDITPMARWDWIRWIGTAKLEETRQRRVVVACSKLRSGMRRPCCFNRNECSLTDA